MACMASPFGSRGTGSVGTSSHSASVFALVDGAGSLPEFSVEACGIQSSSICRRISAPL